MKKQITLLTLFILFFNPIFCQENALQKGLDAITKESVKAQVEFLSSNWMEGRATGEKGEFLAADYLASMLQFMGVQAAGDKDRTRPTREQRWSGVRSEEYTSYFQNIYMTQQLESSTEFSITLLNNQILTFNEHVDFSAYGSNTGMNITSDIVFVGYGFTDKDSGYDDYKGKNVKGKIILRLNGYPGSEDTSSVAYKKFHKEERYFSYYLDRKKDEIAKEKGVAAIIDVYKGDNTKYWSEEQDFKNLDYNEKPYSPIYENDLELPSDTLDTKPIKIYPTKQVINKILENQSFNLQDFEKEQAASLKPINKKLKSINASVEYSVKTKLIQTRNVLGVIEGENKDEIVVIGGHYDHLGMKDGHIWNGADDNASGTIGVWMLAKAFMATGIKPKKTIVFAAWTGEEKGLLGSEYFADNPYGGSIENIKFYLNFDMISKDSDSDTLKNMARMVYTSSYEELEEKSKENISKYNLNLDVKYRPSEKPRGGSDHASFANKNVPIMYFMAGFPMTYHSPKDETSDINWNKMVDIIKLSYLNLWDIVNKN